jgi:NAD+ diphosphatase
VTPPPRPAPYPPLEHLALARGTLDRAAHRRADEDWLAAIWRDPRTRILPVAAGRALVEYAGRGGQRPAAALRLCSTVEAPAGERYLLGVDGNDRAYFAVGVDVLPFVPADAAVEAGLREVGALLEDLETGLLVHAVALDNWHRTHTHCPRCGTPTEIALAGHVRRCPADGSEHYPRTDPAVIMAVVDDEDRILLGHHAAWPARRFSTLAGFVEPGESLEQAVAREVLEETGVEVGRSTYVGSQPWPFPSSLMLGFLAEATTTRITTDDEEIVDARWFSRAELAAAVTTDDVLLPPPVSIARRLVEHWYGAPIPDGGGMWR